MAEPGTPTPASGSGKTPRRRGGAGKGQQRRQPKHAEGEGVEGEIEGEGRTSNDEAGTEEELFGLLGVSSPAGLSKTLQTADAPAAAPAKQRGLLSITRADIEASASAPDSHTTPRVKGRNKTKGQGQVSKDGGAAGAATSGATPSAKGKAGKRIQQQQALVPVDPAGSASNATTDNESAFNISSLSRSLPSTFFAPVPPPAAVEPDDDDGKKKKGRGKGKKQAQTQAVTQEPTATAAAGADVNTGTSKKGRGKDRKAEQASKVDPSRSADEGDVWDIPADAGPSAAQNMTWQQQLGHYPYADSPSRSSSTRKRGTGAGAGNGGANGGDKAASLLKQLAAGGLSGTESASAGGSDSDATQTNTSRRARGAGAKGGNGSAKGSVPPTSFPGLPGFPGFAAGPGAGIVGPAGKGGAGRPGHQRRVSADSVIPPRHLNSAHVGHARQPSLATTTNTNNAANQTYVPSLMDTLPPFNPAINALRAPQTPAKGGLASMYKAQALPLLPGEFPRLNAASGTGMGGMPAGAAPAFGAGHVAGTPGGAAGLPGGGQYAGASFHNSPAASSLPKPDLDDF